MAHKVETMAYAKSGGLPWHGLGNAVNDKMTPEQMCKAAGIDWTVSKHQLYWKGADGTDHEYPDWRALVRDSDNFGLSIVGAKWKEVQNLEVADFLQKFCKEGHMQMETAGSLEHGRYIWCLARINKDFAIGKGSNADQIRSYLLICNPHVHGKAGVAQYTPIRVVCWNTLTFALGAGLKGKEGAFRMPHTRAFDEATKQDALAALGLATEQVEEFKEAATLLSKKKATTEKVEEFFCEVMQWNPKAQQKDKKVQHEPRVLDKFRQALTYAPGATLPSASGTWWGALQAVTYVADHEMSGKGDSTALKNIWLGNYAQIKRNAVNIALKKAA